MIPVQEYSECEQAMRTFLKNNSWFATSLILTILLGMTLVFGLGFMKIIQAVSPLQERLRDVTFPIWDHYPFYQHGFLVFMTPDDLEKGVAYSNHSVGYLLFMYLFYKIELAVPQLPMRAVTAGLEMLACVAAVLYVGLAGQHARIRLQHGALVLLGVMFFLTMPTFWISAGKFNVDNPAHFQFPLLLLVAYRIARGDLAGFGFWVPLGALCITVPTSAVLLGAFLLVSSAGRAAFDKKLFKLAILVMVASAAIYLQPAMISKLLSFKSVNSSWLFRSGLDGDTTYFSNVLNSVASPFFHRPFYLLAIPVSLLLAQLGMIRSQEQKNINQVWAMPGIGNPGLFFGALFSQYLLFTLLWPQAVSIHPYIFDFLLIAPVSLWIVLNFIHGKALLGTPQIWFWAMLFLISFNLQQIAQVKKCKDCYYPTWEVKNKIGINSAIGNK